MFIMLQVAGGLRVQNLTALPVPSYSPSCRIDTTQTAGVTRANKCFSFGASHIRLYSPIAFYKKTQFSCGTSIALRNSTQFVSLIKMQDRIFESVGNVTFCLNEVPHAGRGAVNFTVRQDELSSSNLEEPSARVSGLEDAYGVISLDSQRNKELIYKLNKYFVAKQRLTLKGEFKGKLTGTVMAWMLEVKLSKRIASSSGQERTTTYKFDSALASKGLTGAHDVKRC